MIMFVSFGHIFCDILTSLVANTDVIATLLFESILNTRY